MNQSSQCRRSHWRAICLVLTLVSGAVAVWAQVGTGGSGRDAKAPPAREAKSSTVKPGDAKAFEFVVPKYKDNLLRSKVMGRNAVTHNDVATLKQVHVETYAYAGGISRIDMIVESPACVYDMDKGVAFSPEPITARKGDGSFAISGNGFEYRQNDLHLIISNNCHTTFQLNNARPTAAPRSRP